MKKVIMTILALCMLSTSVFAGTYLPSNTREYRENDKDYIVKAYEVAETNENEFERNVATTYKDGLKVYKLDNISKSGGTTTTSKEETQIKVVETDSNNIEDVLPLFPSEIEYTEDDEFFGSLKLDTTSIVTTRFTTFSRVSSVVRFSSIPIMVVRESVRFRISLLKPFISLKKETSNGTASSSRRA